jgi:cytochrome c553
VNSGEIAVKKYLVSIALLAILPLFASADAPTWSDGSAELTAALAAKGDAARGALAFEPCAGCHRSDASGRLSGAFPRLSSQHAKVLIKQIVDIRSGRRANPKMAPYVVDHALTPQDIADIAIHLQQLPIAVANGKGPGSGVAKGQAIFAKDCAGCHGENGEGNADKFYPMVAAQHYRYLLRELQFIQDGERANSNPDMVKVIKPYSSGDLEALADYMAQLPPPKK